MKNFDRRDEIAFELDHDESECEVSPAALAQPFGLGALLKEEVDAELAQREGSWNAFTHQVFKKVDQLELVETRMSMEERAIEMMRAEVDGELAEMTPRFERDFKVGIEERIWRAAKEKPSFGERVSEWFGAWKRSLSPRPFGYAMAAAAAIAVGVVYNPFATQSIVQPVASQAGVSVDRVSFGGNVTVMSEGDVTVVWLVDDATS